MKRQFLLLFLLIGIFAFGVEAQNKTKYEDAPDESSDTQNKSDKSVNKTLDSTSSPTTRESVNQADIFSQSKSRTRTASTIVRILMGIAGVVCYELPECRESLNVQPTNGRPSRSDQISYTFIPQFDMSKGKMQFTDSSSARSTVNSNPKIPSFYYQLAPKWASSPSEKSGKVTIRPSGSENIGQGNAIRTAIILGVIPIRSENLFAEAQDYVQQMASRNPYLTGGAFKSQIVSGKQCYYKQFSGYSKKVEANESVTFFGCQKNENTMFYSVLVYNDKTSETDKKNFWQIWSSVEF